MSLGLELNSFFPLNIKDFSTHNKGQFELHFLWRRVGGAGGGGALYDLAAN